jgi:tetratricopeptide (TPR) repeat protein
MTTLNLRVPYWVCSDWSENIKSIASGLFLKGAKILIVLGLITTWALEAVSSPSREQFFLQAAGNAIDSGDIKGAISNLDAAIRENPSNPESYAGRGILNFRIGNIENARLDLEKSLSLSDSLVESKGFLGIILAIKDETPRGFDFLNQAIDRGFQNPMAFSARGAILSSRGNFQEAIADLDLAISLAPNLDFAWNDRGIVHFKQERPDLALRDFNQAIKLNPRLLNAYQNRSQVHLMLKDYAAGIRDLDYVIQLDKGRASAYSDRSYHRSELMDHKGAVADLDTAIRLEPRNADFRSQRGRAHLYLKNEALAISDLTAAIELDPTNFTRLVDRARIWESLDKLSSARGDYTKAIELSPSSLTAYEGRAFLSLKEGKPELAVLDYQKALQLDPNHLSVRGMLGTALFEAGSIDEAITNLTISINGNTSLAASSLMVRGRAWLEKRDFTKSIADYSTAAAMQPKDPFPLTARAYAHYLSGSVSQALLDIELAIRFDEKHSRSYATRGMIWMREGEYEKSVNDFSQAIALDPSDSNAYAYRANSLRSLERFEPAIEDYRKALAVDPSNARVREALEFTIQQVRDQLSRSKDSFDDKKRVVGDGRRVALIIGNSKYRHTGQLENPGRDAVLIENTLRAVGFDSVETLFDIDRTTTLAALKQFGRESEKASFALIYFAGHGIEVGGINYLVPVDAKIDSPRSLSEQSVNLEYFLKSAETGARVSLIILDACRDNPFITEISVKSTASRTLALGSTPIELGRGLARVEPQPGTLVVFATKHGSVALDGDSGNSPFARALERRILQTPAIEVRRMFDYVREDVFEATGRRQQPFAYGSLPAREDFFFRR